MSRPTPRRPSRTTTPRPRKIAGRVEPAEDDAPRPAGTKAPAEDPAPTPPAPPKPPRRPVSRAGDDGGAPDQASDKAPDKVPDRAPDKAPDRAPVEDGGGRTSTLLALIGLLVLLLLLQCGWFVWNTTRDESVPASSEVAVDEEDGAQIPVPSGKPVVLNQLAVQEGVEAAAAAAESMFGRNWENYDDGVDSAVALMTEEFAEQYRTTTDDVREEFIRKKTEVQVRVVAQSVVRANEAELEALIFLNQYVFRGEGDNAKSTYTPYRALLTMVHTDQGWLVDGVQTR